ncbi:hypothetical protein B0H66DRAFT_543109 [Apodospora peruviana]|uniref:Gcp-like domain-containing protein n=1 Tax=Apodospora peruviana TaxID=516989 RepID=A0AAE0MFD1_9PEZI|nr:hypothetical protein B0H66DRAFT_543109 [Apodospora peruviana]
MMNKAACHAQALLRRPNRSLLEPGARQSLLFPQPSHRHPRHGQHRFYEASAPGPWGSNLFEIPRSIPTHTRSASRKGTNAAADTHTGTSTHRSTLTLAIETSCDDTCVAVLERLGPAARLHFNKRVTADMRQYRGVHPAHVVRSHEAVIADMIQEAFQFLPEARKDHFAYHSPDTVVYVRDLQTGKVTARRKPDFVAATRGPGMRNSLQVGFNAAKGLALGWQVPLIGVHHMQAHTLTPLLCSALEMPWPSPSSSPPAAAAAVAAAVASSGSDQDRISPSFPFLTVLASGGHTQLVYSESLTSHQILADTMDVAIGDMLDKAARVILPATAVAEARHTSYGVLLEQFAFPDAEESSVPSSSAPQYNHKYKYVPPVRRRDEILPFDAGFGWTLQPPLAPGCKMAYSFAGIGGAAQRIASGFAADGDGDLEARRALARGVMKLAFEHLATRVMFALGDRRTSRQRSKGAAMATSWLGRLEGIVRDSKRKKKFGPGSLWRFWQKPGEEVETEIETQTQRRPETQPIGYVDDALGGGGAAAAAAVDGTADIASTSTNTEQVEQVLSLQLEQETAKDTAAPLITTTSDETGTTMCATTADDNATATKPGQEIHQGKQNNDGYPSATIATDTALESEQVGQEQDTQQEHKVVDDTTVVAHDTTTTATTDTMTEKEHLGTNDPTSSTTIGNIIITTTTATAGTTPTPLSSTDPETRKQMREERGREMGVVQTIREIADKDDMEEDQLIQVLQILQEMRDARLQDQHRNQDQESPSPPPQKAKKTPLGAQIQDIVISGGVASNKYLRHILRAFLDMRQYENIRLHAPPQYLCTDNAAMIAWAASEMHAAGWRTDFGAAKIRNWPLDPDNGGGGGDAEAKLGLMGPGCYYHVSERPKETVAYTSAATAAAAAYINPSIAGWSNGDDVAMMQRSLSGIDNVLSPGDGDRHYKKKKKQKTNKYKSKKQRRKKKVDDNIPQTEKIKAQELAAMEKEEGWWSKLL